MSNFYIPAEITVRGNISIEADSQEEAWSKAENAMFWAYQSGDPTKCKNFTIDNTEIGVEGEEIDLDSDEYGEPQS